MAKALEDFWCDIPAILKRHNSTVSCHSSPSCRLSFITTNFEKCFKTCLLPQEFDMTVECRSLLEAVL